MEQIVVNWNNILKGLSLIIFWKCLSIGEFGMNQAADKGLDVLIVDDESLVRQVIIGNMSEKFPTFHFRTADSGHMALALINERIPDLVLLDLRMPGLNGFTLIRLLRGRDLTRRLPIIVVSALKDRASVIKAIEAGATDYCGKPIDFEMLAHKVERICTNMLNRHDLVIRQRTSPRRKIHTKAQVVMPVRYPEREGVWIASPFDVIEGEPILFDGSEFFKALRLNMDNPMWWSRVEFCRREAESYDLKLLFDPVPADYGQQLTVLNRARSRFTKYFGGGQESLSLEFPCSLVDICGNGLRVVSELPWKKGSKVSLNLSSLVELADFEVSSPIVSGIIQWSMKEGHQHIGGMRLSDIEDTFQEQLMAYCLPRSELLPVNRHKRFPQSK
jgi:CheY-like chemotaxis protein